MLNAIGHGNPNASGGNVAVNSSADIGTASGPGGLLNQEKDQKTASTEAKFGEVLQQIQAKYGAKTEKPREIKKTLGKDDFLRIMITQMKNQDPTKPFNADQMAQQMAQYTSVEQLQNVNQNLTKMQNQNQPLERMAMTNMIGKVVTVDRERFPHTEGSHESLAFALPKNSKSVKVAIISEKGETVLEKDVGALKAGENAFTWDGVGSNTVAAKTGNYMIRVEAKDEKGMAMQTNPQTTARVVGVSFEGPEAVFLVGDARHQDKIMMKNIVRIETDPGQAQMIAPQMMLPQATGVATGAAAQMPGAGAIPPNFIAFQKGEGSATLNPSEASPEVAEALARFQAMQAQNAAGETKQAEVHKSFGAPEAPSAPAEVPSRPAERGFPSGLSDPEQQQAVNAGQAGAPVAPSTSDKLANVSIGK